MRIAFFVLSLLLFINAFWVSFSMRFTVGLFSLYVFAIFLLLLAIFHAPITQFASSGIGLVLKRLILLGVLLFFSILLFLFVNGGSKNITYQEKAVIILGAGLQGEEVNSTLQHRLDAAYQYYTKNKNAYIVVTGGQSSTQVIPEAIAMQRYLLTKGVPSEQILVDSASLSTEQNLLNARVLLTEKGISYDDSILIVSNRFHNYRAGKYAQESGFTNFSTLAAPLPALMVLPCYFREAFAIIHFFIFRRL